MIFTYVLVFLFCLVFTMIILYLLSIYVFPKKIEEIQKMIDTGQIKLAIRKLTDILEKDDRNPYAHYLLAEAYLAENNSQYAILEYRKVLKLGRFDERINELYVRSNLAKLFKERKAYEEARKEYLQLTKIDSSNFENFYEVGFITYVLGEIDKAIGYLKKSASLNVNHDLSFYYLGQIYYKKASYIDAKQFFLETIKIDSDNYYAHYYLGLVLRQQGDYEWAMKEFEISQKSDELKVKSLLLYGTCLMERGQYPKAIVSFERGLKLAKKGGDTELNFRYILAGCYESMRDIQTAIQHWDKIVKIDPKFKDVPQKLLTYSDFRQDDLIKDFMIANLAQFEHLCRKIVISMHYSIIDLEIFSDTEIEIVAIENSGQRKNTRHTNRIIRIVRTAESLDYGYFRKLHESMKARNVGRIVVITTGDVSSKAIEFASTRPIEIKNKSDLVEMLKKI